MTTPAGIDPRGPRFAAAITATLLLVAVVLSLLGVSTARFGDAAFGWYAYQPLSGETFGAIVGGWVLPAASFSQRILDPGFLLLLVIGLLFLWGVASPRTAPWGAVFRRFVRPRLAAPEELEDPRPPRFAQGVGLFVVTIGLVLHLIGVPWALPIAAAAAFIAAFLNAVFDYCLGCQLYLLLQRAGILGRTPKAV